MSDVYTSTDTVAPLGVLQACAPVAPTGDADAVEASIGGTAGVTQLAVDVPASSSVTGYAVELAIDDATTLSGGTLTMRMNVSSAQMDLTWTEVYVCRVNSSGVSQEELGNSTGMAKDISAGGIFTEPITISAASAHNPGDRIYIVCVFANAFTMSSRSVTITPDQNIDTPFVTAAPDPASIEQTDWRWRADDGSESAATWLAPAGTDITVGTGEDIPFDTNVRLRTRIENVGGVDAALWDFDFWRRVNGGSWVQIDGTSTYVRSGFTSGNIVDDEATTAQLGADIETQTENVDSISRIMTDAAESNCDANAGQAYEIEILVQLRSADFTAGDTVEIKGTAGDNVATDYDAYKSSTDATGPDYAAVTMPAGGVTGSLLAGTVSVAAGILTAALGALAAPLTAATLDVQAGVLAGAQAPLTAPMVAGTVDAQAGVLAGNLAAKAGTITVGTVDVQAGILTGSAGGLDPVSGALTAGTVEVRGGVLAGNQTALAAGLTAGTVQATAGVLAGSQAALTAGLTAGRVEVSGGALSAAQGALAAGLTEGTIETRAGVLAATEGALAQALTPGSVEVRAGVLAGATSGTAGSITTGTVEVKAGVLVGLAVVGAPLTSGTVEVRGGVLAASAGATTGTITSGAVEVRAGVLSATPAPTTAALTAATVEARGHVLAGTLAAEASAITAGTVDVRAGVLGGISGTQPISAALVTATVEVAASPFLVPVSPEQVIGARPRDTILGAKARPTVIGARPRDTIIGAT